MIKPLDKESNVMYKKHFSIIFLTLLSFSCSDRRAVKEIDLSNGCLPKIANIPVNWHQDNEIWQRAVVIPFMKTGEARFVWDEQHIHGFVSDKITYKDNSVVRFTLVTWSIREVLLAKEFYLFSKKHKWVL